MEIISRESQEMLYKLRQSGRYCCIDISSDYHYVWYVNLTRSHEENSKHEISFRSGPCENLNNAILAAYEFDKTSKG